MTKKGKPLEILEKTTHSQANPLSLQRIVDLMTPIPNKKELCKHLGIEFGKETISGTHLDNELFRLVGMNYTQLENLIMIDVVARVKASMVVKALDGDVSAGKYVLANVGDWSDKTEVKNSNIGMTLEEFLKQQSDKLKEGK